MIRVAALAGVLVAACPPPPSGFDAGCSPDLQTDSQHCGACGNACPAGTRCGGGRCAPTCAGLTCDAACIDPKVDPNHCGACGHVCAALHAAPVCLAGRCGRGACQSGWYDCDQDPENGCEVESPLCELDVCGKRPDGGEHLCSLAALSADARTVLVTSRDVDFAAPDTAFGEHLYVFRRDSRARQRLTRLASGGYVTGTVSWALLSGDGTRAVFEFTGQLLAPYALDRRAFYAADLETGRLAAIAPPDLEHLLSSERVALSHDGRWLTLDTRYLDGGRFAQRIELGSEDPGTWVPAFDRPAASGDGQVLAVRGPSDSGDALGGDFYLHDLRDGGVSLMVAPAEALPFERPFLMGPQLDYAGARFAAEFLGVSWLGSDAGVREGVLLGPRAADGSVLALSGERPGLSYDGRRVGLWVRDQVGGQRMVVFDTGTGARLGALTRPDHAQLSGDGRTLAVEALRRVHLKSLPAQ